MKLTRWNGERWYEDNRSVWRHIFEWIVWVGGRPTPVSLFGHRVTFFGWGWQVRIGGGYLVRVTKGVDRRTYWSPDGTPTHATVWFSLPPLGYSAAVGENAPSSVTDVLASLPHCPNCVTPTESAGER